MPNPGVRKTTFPKNAQELTLAATWKLIKDDHTVLIYCPQKSSVEAFATAIIDLHKRGALNSILSVPKQQLEHAKVLGCEWLGENHSIMKCLDIGVAIHHGGLPTPFRKEMETLLRAGVLKVTVSSPTLAQGLNLAATVVIVHSLYRNGNIIDTSEFKNVIGRAGRAFIDTHGLVLHPVFDKHNWRTKLWHDLVIDTNARNMESGLVRLVASFLNRLATSMQADLAKISEYITNNIHAWQCPDIDGETKDDAEKNRSKWNNHLVRLDTALLSLLGKEDLSIVDIPNALDSILQSSLWQRCLNRYPKKTQISCNSLLVDRSRYIWNATTTLQRKGYFLAGVGLDTGQQLDAISHQANILLINSNIFILTSDEQSAIDTIIKLADLIFNISPFTPSILPNDWQNILATWLKGEIITEGITTDIDSTLKFIEDALVYRLPWGLEAIRVRAQANEDEIINGSTIDDYELDLVVPAIENGTLNRSSAMLMQAGFNSRQAAIYAVNSTNASFTNSRQFEHWINSDLVFDLSLGFDWPTIETSALWWTFLEEYQPTSKNTWNNHNELVSVDWLQNQNPQLGIVVKLWNTKEGHTKVIASDGEQIGILHMRYKFLDRGIYSSVVAENNNFLYVTYWGVGDAPFKHSVKV